MSGAPKVWARPPPLPAPEILRNEQMLQSRSEQTNRFNLLQLMLKDVEFIKCVFMLADVLSLYLILIPMDFYLFTLIFIQFH